MGFAKGMNHMDKVNDSLLAIALQSAVPLWQMTVAHWPDWLIQQEAEAASQMIATKGDELLYGGKQCAETFNQVAKGLAILSLCPGGISAFGSHWEM